MTVDWWLAFFLIFILGGCLASFLGVLYYRVPRKMNWISERSACDHCHKKISWYCNIPIFSYLILRGRCQFCHKKIPAFYFCWEMIGGLFLVWWWYNFLWPGEEFVSPLLWLVFGEALIYVALVDWQKRYVTANWLLALSGMTIINVGWQLWSGVLTFADLGWRALAAASLYCFFVAIDWIAKKIWRVPVALGRGDALLVLILAFWLTPKQSLVMLLLAFWTGAAVGILSLIRQKIWHKGDGKLAFIPFMTMGFFLAVSVSDFLGKLFGF